MPYVWFCITIITEYRINMVYCSFFGHRKIKITKMLRNKVYGIVEDLITQKSVMVFLFGSKSQFDNLCLQVVSELKQKYPYIQRVAYTCKSESCILENEKKQWEQIFSKLDKKEIEIVCFDAEYEFKSKYTAGRASYVERNQAMINQSNYCVFYYDSNYLPPQRKYSKFNISYTQPKSGTRLSYEYARQKKKHIINVFDK